MIHKCFEGNTTQDEKPSYHKKKFLKKIQDQQLKGLRQFLTGNGNYSWGRHGNYHKHTHIKNQRSKIISAHLHSLFQGTSLHIHNCTLQDYLNCFYKSLRSCTDQLRHILFVCLESKNFISISSFYLIVLVDNQCQSNNQFEICCCMVGRRDGHPRLLILQISTRFWHAIASSRNSTAYGLW